VRKLGAERLGDVLVSDPLNRPAQSLPHDPAVPGGTWFNRQT
jgi:hypothetical protein